MIAVLSASHVTIIPRSQKLWRIGSNMNIYEIGIMLTLWALTIVFFYSMGVDAGYKEGRRAVRKFYEQRDKVRA
jgi:mannose/fructose/N-acetylgalactosamine-specific phosphotransferase system component IID